jgi:hypothetical protein
MLCAALNAALLRALALAFSVVLLFSLPSALAAQYYQEQTDFTETTVPRAEFLWDHDIHVCIFKEDGVPNKYYVWAKLAVQDWRQALREYTGNEQAWSMTARYVASESQMSGCSVKTYIYDTYRDFPDYPEQTGAYTAVEYRAGVAETASVYLSPRVLHGDGATEIDLPTYAFRNSAVHEMGHVLGLGHMASQKGYLMSPIFDFFDNDDQLPITTLELETLVKMYGEDGFDRTISIL